MPSPEPGEAGNNHHPPLLPSSVPMVGRLRRAELCVRPDDLLTVGVGERRREFLPPV